VSWRNPTAKQRKWNLDTYVEALLEAIDVVRAITGAKDVNLQGACSGR
jgi:polyhydroxyalkanoate synthase